MHFNARAMGRVSASSNDVNFVAVPDKTRSKALGKPCGAINVWSEGVTSHDYLEFFQR
jgi:hypothetical protein